MKPGRELDALVAEKVMGYDSAETEGIGDGPWVYGKGGFLTEVPHYSTSIEAAWEVFLKLGDDYGIQRRGDRWIVFVGYHDWIASEADAAPHAIALAALKAVTSKV